MRTFVRCYFAHSFLTVAGAALFMFATITLGLIRLFLFHAPSEIRNPRAFCLVLALELISSAFCGIFGMAGWVAWREKKVDQRHGEGMAGGGLPAVFPARDRGFRAWSPPHAFPSHGGKILGCRLVCVSAWKACCASVTTAATFPWTDPDRELTNADSTISLTRRAHGKPARKTGGRKTAGNRGVHGFSNFH